MARKSRTDVGEGTRGEGLYRWFVRTQIHPTQYEQGFSQGFRAYLLFGREILRNGPVSPLEGIPGGYDRGWAVGFLLAREIHG